MINIRISIRLHLAVDDEWVPADLVVAEGLPINADASALSIVIDDTEHLLDVWNLGRVDLITAQADDCVRRLRRTEPAILRSAVLGVLGVPYLLFDPPEREGESARVSKFFITDDLVGSWLPLPGWGVDDPQDLFDWVEQHRSELLGPAAAEPEDGDPMVELPVPFDELLGQLEVLAATGRDVLGGDPVVGWDD